MAKIILSSFIEKINEQSNKFLKQIEAYCREGFEYNRKELGTIKSDFEVLGLNNEKYNINKQQEELLEWRIRDELVNAIFDYLFNEHGYDIRWRLETYETYGGPSNRVYEEAFPVEFFLVEDDNYIAFKYSPFMKDYSIPLNLPQMFKTSYSSTGVKEISKWYHIDWSISTDIEKSIEGSQYQSEITLKGLFEKYFSIEEYDVYINLVQKTIKKAQNMIGFSTFSKLVPGNRYMFRKGIVEDLNGVERLKYQMVTEKGDIKSKEAEVDLSDMQSKAYITFYDECRRFALVGTKKFAESYITAEYMYATFDSSVVFDYTSIVCGYIKSVEQLSETIIYEILPKLDVELYYNARILTKQEKRKLLDLDVLKIDGKSYKVLMKEGLQEYFGELTMGQQFSFFEENADMIFSIEDEKDMELVKQMFKCIKNYVSFDRNGYFHKHNINDYRIVERIRNNTKMLHYWILGTVRIPREPSVVNDLLGIKNDSFDELFRKIVHRGRGKYIVDFGDGIKRKTIRIPEECNYTFDSHGGVENAELRFLEVNVFPNNFMEYEEYINNMDSCNKIIVINEKAVPEEVRVVETKGADKLIFKK